jgi:acetylornithine deacetylase/succinyl-diaminopimelate desuccinylase-like protein
MTLAYATPTEPQQPLPMGKMDLTDYVNANRQRYIDELVTWLRIPSISSSSQHKGEVARAGEHLRAEMERLGMTAQIFPTRGHPVVYGEWLKAGPNKPTVLIYGHYDVQPVDPLDLWHSPPFEPVVKNGELFARGSVDDKGQVWLHLKAFEAFMKNAGGPPVNVKMIVEGEEEIGSEHLGDFLDAERERLTADAVIVSDSPMFGRGIPSICFGLRGLCYMEIQVEGSTVDLHSGSFGGAINNPVNALAHIIAQLKDPNGKILIPGFYKKVRKLTARERKDVKKLPFKEKEWLKPTGSPKTWGEKGFHVLERTWARPTLDVNGIWGGFQGEGAKTIIPAKAAAKVSMRLVPDQSSDAIAKLFTAYVKKIAPKDMKVTVINHHGGEPFLSPVDDPAFRATERALQRAFGKKPVLIREGGSIPFLATIYETLRKPCILMGFGLPDENSHAPNEKLDLENYQKGILSAVYLLEELAKPQTNGKKPNGKRGRR